MTRRRLFRFVGRGADGRYYWEAPVAGDSRYEQISCPVRWYWSKAAAS